VTLLTDRAQITTGTKEQAIQVAETLAAEEQADEAADTLAAEEPAAS